MKKQVGLLCELFGVLLALAAAFLLLAGCQPTPETEAVTSKNDGTYEAAIHSESTTDDDDIEEETTSYSGTFTNTDGTVSFEVDLQEFPDSAQSMPVIQVTPHTITSEDARAVANALFESAEWYEYSEAMSKSELEEKILSLKRIISDQDYLNEYYGGDETLINATITQYESMIETYESQYSDAPDTVEKKLCDWEFYPLSYYTDQAALDTTTEEYQNWNKTVYIRATAEIDNIPYEFWACNRDEDDYREHYYNAFINYGGSAGEAYSTAAPTDEDIEEAKDRAAAVLSVLGTGEWSIESCETESFQRNNGDTVYHITITATPVYQGVKVTHQDTDVDIAAEDTYAANYGYEEATFDFSGGRLAEFCYSCPLEVVATVQEDAAVLSFAEIMETFESYSRYAEVSTTYPNVGSMEVTVNNVEFGLSRIRVQNSEQDFYLTPTYTFYGNEVLYNEDGSVMERLTGETLVVINAVDASIIDVSKGY